LIATRTLHFYRRVHVICIVSPNFTRIKQPRRVSYQLSLVMAVLTAIMSIRYFRSSRATMMTISFHYGRRRQFLSPYPLFLPLHFLLRLPPALSVPAVFFFPSLPPSFSLTHFIPFSNPFPSPFFPPLSAPVNTFCGTWYLPYSQVHSDRTVRVVTVILHILHSACACAKRPHFHFMFLDSDGDCV